MFEVRVTIAAQACLLLLGHDADVPYPALDVVRVYPNTYRARGRDHADGVVAEGTSHRHG